MKCALTLFIMLISLFVKAQESSWFSIGKEWKYHYGFGFSRDFSYVTLKVIEEIKVRDRRCHVLSATVYQPENVEYMFPKIHPSELILCEDNDIIYRDVDDEFHELYNYNHEKGDTVKIYIPKENRSSTIETHAYFTIDSIETFIINDQTLRASYFRPVLNLGLDDYASFFIGWNIETLGNLRYIIPFSDLDCDWVCPKKLRCVTDDRMNLNVNFSSSPCDIFFILSTEVEEIAIESDFSLFPNPNLENGIVTISNLPVDQYNIEVLTMDGNRVLQTFFKGSQYSFPADELPSSHFFLVRIYNDKVNKLKKLVNFQP